MTAAHGFSLEGRFSLVTGAPYGIWGNVIASGDLATEPTRDRAEDPELSARTPAGRWGDGDELGGAVIFSASDASSCVDCHLPYVDRGQTVVL